jgi:hypothetical protein
VEINQEEPMDIEHPKEIEMNWLICIISRKVIITVGPLY